MTEAISYWLLLKVFASGCTAITGVEAVSNGVQSVPRSVREERSAHSDRDYCSAGSAAGGTFLSRVLRSALFRLLGLWNVVAKWVRGQRVAGGAIGPGTRTAA